MFGWVDHKSKPMSSSVWARAMVWKLPRHRSSRMTFFSLRQICTSVSLLRVAWAGYWLTFVMMQKGATVFNSSHRNQLFVLVCQKAQRLQWSQNSRRALQTCIKKHQMRKWRFSILKWTLTRFGAQDPLLSYTRFLMAKCEGLNQLTSSNWPEVNAVVIH